MAVRVETFPDGAALAQALAGRVARALASDLRAQDRAGLVVSGGRSPVPFFEALAETPLDWARVIVTLADERCVPADHPDSNAGLVRRHLLRGPAAAATFLPLVEGAGDPAAQAVAASARLAALPRPASAIVLGLGEDGHTASLFPDAPELAQGLACAEPVVALHPGAAPHARLSFSRAALLEAREIFLMAGGSAKRAVLDRALAPGAVEALPVRAVLHQDRVPVAVFWAP